MSANDTPTPVAIYGKTYHLRGDGDTAYLHELAQEVDRRMREVAETTGTADTLSLAILAALNITDECFQVQRGPVSTETEQQLGRWVDLIDETLADPVYQPFRAGFGRADGSA
jgi:cell division protein ZapA (FtsZ GTPase activity inhibitor)